MQIPLVRIHLSGGRGSGGSYATKIAGIHVRVEVRGGEKKPIGMLTARQRSVDAAVFAQESDLLARVPHEGQTFTVCPPKININIYMRASGES